MEISNQNKNVIIKINQEEYLHYHEHFDTWVCVCGNYPKSDDGFWQCDINGDHVRPTFGEIPHDLGHCGRCGRFFKLSDQKVLGFNFSPKSWRN